MGEIGRRRKSANENHFNQQVGIALMKCREKSKLTCVELAERVGVTPSTVYWWEIGRNGISPYLLIKVSRVLRVSLNELLGEIYL
jgi:transcriptional regulator with XRE-family HTH domain